MVMSMKSRYVPPGDQRFSIPDRSGQLSAALVPLHGHVRRVAARSGSTFLAEDRAVRRLGCCGVSEGEPLIGDGVT
jgi:hypothetical protein